MASGSSDDQLNAVKNYVSQMLGDPEETRKILVQSIAANIYENLKKNSEMKDILKDLLISGPEKSSCLKGESFQTKSTTKFEQSNLIESSKNISSDISNKIISNEFTKSFRRSNNEESHDRTDSGAFSEDEGVCLYKSSCKIQSKAYEEALPPSASFGEMEHERHLLPVPIAEINDIKPQHNIVTGKKPEQPARNFSTSSSSQPSQDELVAEKAFEKLYEKLEATGELRDLNIQLESKREKCISQNWQSKRSNSRESTISRSNTSDLIPKSNKNRRLSLEKIFPKSKQQQEEVEEKVSQKFKFPEPSFPAPVFQKTNLRESATNLKKSNSREFYLQNSNLAESNLQKLNSQEPNFQKSNFQESNFQNSHFQNSHFQEPNFQTSKSQESNLQESNFPKSNFGDSNFHKSNVQEHKYECVSVQERHESSVQECNSSFSILNSNFQKYSSAQESKIDRRQDSNERSNSNPGELDASNSNDLLKPVEVAFPPLTYASHLPPLEDPSVILTSPTDSLSHNKNYQQFKTVQSINPNLREEIHDVQEDKARSFIQEVLKEKTVHNSSSYSQNSLPRNQLIQSQSLTHFEELKAKQKEEHLQFHQKLIQELGQTQTSKPTRNPLMVNTKGSEERDPPPIHVYDPLHPTASSPIPRRRNESESSNTNLNTNEQFADRRLNPRQRSGSGSNLTTMPIKYNTIGRNVDDSWINKGNFWSSPNSPRTLPRARRRVTFVEDRPSSPFAPERPPPPAPVRQTSYQAVNNFLLQGISFGSPLAGDQNETDGNLKQMTLDKIPNAKRDEMENEDEYKVDLGQKGDPWFELYGRAVLDNTLQDRIDAHQKQQQQQAWFKQSQEGKNKFSYVQQLLQEEEERKKEKTDPPAETSSMDPPAETSSRQLPLHVDALKSIVRNVLRSQGISNPSDQVLEESIKYYLQNNSEQVFVGSASEGVLYPGDRVVAINHQDTSRLTHHEAQNLIKNSGTSARVDIVRPGMQAPKRGSLPGMSSGMSPGGFFQPMDNEEVFERECEMAKVHSQPYRTTPLVTPAPRTINEIAANRISSPVHFKPAPFHQNSSSPVTVKTVNICGAPKQLVSKQFNSPINLYSDDAIAEAVVANPPVVQANMPTLGQLQQHQQHPGYVQGTRPHLPTPKDATFSRPQASETFKIILESEMDKAKDQKGVTGSEFTKQQAHFDRPASSASNKASNIDPVMMDKSINQSASFKRIMYSVLDPDEY